MIEISNTKSRITEIREFINFVIGEEYEKLINEFNSLKSYLDYLRSI